MVAKVLNKVKFYLNIQCKNGTRKPSVVNGSI